MSLTPQDVKQLCAAFRRDDHEFIEDFVYLTEDAITARIESVDRDWQFKPEQVIANGDSVVAVFTMTIKGVSRTGVGGGTIQREAKEWVDRKWTGKYVPMSPLAIAENGVNAYKAAATDALKRCARLFGIGRYLLDAPKGKGAEAQFNQWLAQKQKELGVGGMDTQTGEVVEQKPATQPAPAPVVPANLEAARQEIVEAPLSTESDADPLQWVDDMRQPALGLVEPPEGTQSKRKWVAGMVKEYAILEKGYCKVSAHFDNLIADLYKNQRISDATTTEGVKAEIDLYYADGHHLTDKKPKERKLA